MVEVKKDKLFLLLVLVAVLLVGLQIYGAATGGGGNNTISSGGYNFIGEDKITLLQ